MHSTPIKPADLDREELLQQLMEGWPAHDGWEVAGVPSWLRNATRIRRPKQLSTSLGWNFQPDLVFEDADNAYVVELKRSGKSKDPVPLALPEALHHAWMLQHSEHLRKASDIGAKPVVPVMMGPMNGWLRAALAFLAEHGLTRDAIRYVEFGMFQGGGRRFLWVGEPFADWTPSGPPWEVAGAEFDFPHWRAVADEQAWFGLGQDLAERPPFVRNRCMEAALVEGTTSDWVACVGEFGRDDWKYTLLSA